MLSSGAAPRRPFLATSAEDLSSWQQRQARPASADRLKRPRTSAPPQPPAPPPPPPSRVFARLSVDSANSDVVVVSPPYRRSGGGNRRQAWAPPRRDDLLTPPRGPPALPASMLSAVVARRARPTAGGDGPLVAAERQRRPFSHGGGGGAPLDPAPPSPHRSAAMWAPPDAAPLRVLPWGGRNPRAGVPARTAPPRPAVDATARRATTPPLRRHPALRGQPAPSPAFGLPPEWGGRSDADAAAIAEAMRDNDVAEAAAAWEAAAGAGRRPSAAAVAVRRPRREGAGGRPFTGGRGDPPSRRAAAAAAARGGRGGRRAADDVDLDAMSYEEILALTERVGNVVVGVPPEVFDRLPTTTIRSPATIAALTGGGGSNALAQGCSVCLEEFAVGEQVCGLPCNHVFHTDCIRPWLAEHMDCPMCKGRVCK